MSDALALLDSLLSTAPSLEDQLEKLTREAARPQTIVCFRTTRGLLFLEELNDEEARSFASRGKLSEDEVREWWSWRNRRLLYPREARYEMFLLKARRAGIHRIAVYDNGQVEVVR